MSGGNIIDMTGGPCRDADEFPASRAVHWPSGVVFACDEHAAGLIKLGEVMGFQVPVSYATPGWQCSNCVNGQKGEER